MFLLLLLAACSDNELIDQREPKLADEEDPDPTVWDGDHDGSADAYDCEPEDADVFPGRVELCDGVDNNCDDVVDDGFDADGDGYWDIRDCFSLEGEWDCNDDVATIFPGAEEVCNGLDDDCNGEADEVDADNDNYNFCDDCDDNDGFAFPGAPEACDGVDNDCDDDIDEIWDEDGDGFSPCQGDCDDRDDTFYPGRRELCDGEDNDCDDRVDEDDDLDADGQATCAGDCDDANAAVYLGATEICDGFDNDCDPTTDEDADVDVDGYSICTGDCDDDYASANPAGVEACDDLDNDCNGYTDELESCWSCTSTSGFLVCAETTDWETAAQACEGMGYEMAMIGGTTENTDLAAAALIPTWIGLSDRDVEGDWTWIDGDPLGYDNWLVGEPTESDSYDCVVTNTAGRRGYWASETCASDFQFACE